MLTEKQLKILNILKYNKDISFSDLKKQLKESSSSYLQKTISDFSKENLILINKRGRNNFISLNYESNLLFDYLSIIEKRGIPEEVFSLIHELLQKILKKTEFFSFIIFGSYARKNNSKKSDLDIAVILENGNIKNRIIPEINSVKRKSLKEIDSHVFTRKEFLEMLKDEKENLGKEIVRKHTVVYGLGNFYNLILKEVKNVSFG